MRYFSCLVAMAALCLSCSALAADPTASTLPAVVTHGDPPPLSDFLKRDAFGTIKISPTGEYLAANVPFTDHSLMVVLRRSDLTPTAHITLPLDTHVANFDWVTDTRILYSVAVKQGDLAQPRPTGELFAIDADGSIQHGALIGWRSGSSGLRQVGASFIDTLRGNTKEVLISVADATSHSEVDRMNIVTGHLFTIARSPVLNGHFVVDPSGVARFAIGEGEDLRVKTYYRADARSDWELINDEAKTQIQVEPRGFSADGKTAYLQVQESSGPDGIYAFDTTTRARTLLYRDPVADPAEFLRSPEDGSVYAAIFRGGKPSVQYLDPGNRYAKQLRAVQASFDNAIAEPTSYTKDGAIAVYRVYSDRIPSDYYIFDRNANSETFAASRASWFKPEMLSEMRPVTFKARDGLQVHGLLTIPRGTDGKNLPLVINPHGGPFGIEDEWGYNPEVQLLASRGYAVLQVNYRGSAGYGRAFLHAGYKQWGGTMQDDLTDATHWAIDQGIADAHRICIYGASYGGYAALEGVAKEPSLYRCAIGYVGVYDMPTMYHEGDIHYSRFGSNFLLETLGSEHLDEISPTKLASRITVPVMMVAGKDDVRAPPKHTEMMRDALRQAGKQVDAKIYDNEGHGFYTDADRLDLYTRMLAFLDRNIGPAANTTDKAADKH